MSSLPTGGGHLVGASLQTTKMDWATMPFTLTQAQAVANQAFATVWFVRMVPPSKDYATNGYQYIPGGKASECPRGTAIHTAAKCGIAGLEEGGKLRDGIIISFTWGHTPCGCFLQKSGAGDKHIYFDTGAAGCKANAYFGNVCKVATYDYQYIPGGKASECPSGTAITTTAACLKGGI
jgi:hypothetical protein